MRAYRRKLVVALELGELLERSTYTHARITEVHDHCGGAFELQDAAKPIPVV
jgi:hypothetical protein